MIRSHFGLQKNPFDGDSLTLLTHQQEVLDILKVHAQQLESTGFLNANIG